MVGGKDRGLEDLTLRTLFFKTDLKTFPICSKMAILTASFKTFENPSFETFEHVFEQTEIGIQDLQKGLEDFL